VNAIYVLFQMCVRVFYVKGDFVYIKVVSFVACRSLINLGPGKIGGSRKDSAACVV